MTDDVAAPAAIDLDIVERSTSTIVTRTAGGGREFNSHAVDTEIVEMANKLAKLIDSDNGLICDTPRVEVRVTVSQRYLADGAKHAGAKQLVQEARGHLPRAITRVSVMP